MSLSRCLFSFLAFLWLLGLATADVRTFVWDDFSHLTHTTNTGAPFIEQIESPWITSDMYWQEAIVAWNARLPDTEAINIELRAEVAGEQTPWLQLGHWSLSTNRVARTSIRGQSNRLSRVDTDTVVLATNGQRFQWRIAFTSPFSTNTLRLLSVSLWRPGEAPNPYSSTLIRNLNLGVPRLSQGDYKGGATKWCSPTSLAMILSYWANREHRPDWEFRVPQVAAAVFDPAWPGTGNWPFNIAFAGSLPGLRANVVRFNHLEALHPWLAAGVPIGLSLSYNRLLGRDFGGSGHLVVCVGLESGDYLVNDPGSKAQPRRRIDAKTLDMAWRESERVAYLVFPENLRVPEWPGVRTIKAAE